MFLAFVPTSSFLPRRSSHSKSVSSRRNPRLCAVKALLPPDHVEFSRDEGLDDTESADSMHVWNSVIHASLKRKLQGLVAESPVVSGVSALLKAAPGYTAQKEENPEEAAMGQEFGLNKIPEDVVAEFLEAFRNDILAGAKYFIKAASDNNHVKSSSPQALVLFIGDNESYRVLLHVSRFSCKSPRWEQSGERCVIAADVWGVGGECAMFDFQMEKSSRGAWLVEEVFRL